MRALFAKYDEIPWQDGRMKGIHIKPLTVGKLCATMIKWDKGTEFGPTEHADEQIDFLLKGKVEWTIKDDEGERTEMVTEGMAIGLEPHVVHGGRALEDSMAVEIHCPRERHRELSKKLGLLVS